MTIDGRTGWVIGRTPDDGGYQVVPTRWGLKPKWFENAADARKYLRKRHKGRHPSKRLRCPGVGLIDIDVMMVDIIKATWKLGLRTLLCCQNQSPYEFKSKLPGRWHMIKLPAADAWEWMKIVNPHDEWIKPFREGAVAKPPWSFSAYPDDDDFGIFIYFRWSERARVLKALRSALR
jgi:hypothetical protein